MSETIALAIVTALARIVLLVMVYAFLKMLLRLEAHKWASDVVSKYTKAIEGMFITACVILFFSSVLTAGLTIWDPVRMTNYLTNILGFLRHNLLNY